MNLFQLDRNKFDPLVLPEPDGTTVILQEKVYVPVKDFPDVSRKDISLINCCNLIKQFFTNSNYNFFSV